MSAFAVKTRSRPVAEFSVYVRRVRSGTPPEMGQIESATGGEGGWVFDGALRVQSIRYLKGPNTATAAFHYVPLGSSDEPFEAALLRYSTDDQVRVVMYPPLANLDPQGGEAQGVTVFEGVLARNNFRVVRQENQDSETTTLTAIASPVFDNRSPDHFIRGRWVQDIGEVEGDDWLIDSPEVPAVFNHRGQPNMLPTDHMTADAGELDLQARMFTFDGHSLAEYWTVREALLAIIVKWVYGKEGEPLTRSCTLEWLTYQALTGLDDAGDRWTGLDDILPETDIHGLGPFEAIERVCNAAGFEMSNSLPMGRPDPEDAIEPDRLYQLRIWRSGAGPANTIKLMRRGTFRGLTADQALSQNNIKTMTGMIDATRVRNHVIATGPTLIEGSFICKPLWSATEVDGTAIGPQLRMEVNGQAGNTYRQKHVAGVSSLFEDYKHVGRLWGIDCTGEFNQGDFGYDSEAYGHDAGGFDFPGVLGIDGTDALSTERAANNVTDPARWTKRNRLPRPLKRVGLEKIRNGMYLEVSEDSGGTWSYIDVAWSLVSGLFAIMLNVQDLAAVNAAWYQDKRDAPEVADSWWKLATIDEALLFRLTCMVGADHATRHDAKRSLSGTLYSRAALVETSIAQHWVSPSSALGGGSWAKLDTGDFGASTVGADRTPAIQDAAERARDRDEVLRLSLDAATWFMDPSLFQVGDSITAISGRNYPLGISSGNGSVRYPSIASVTMTCAGERDQGIAIDLTDDIMRRGA